MTTEQREPLYASTAKPWLKYYDQKYIDMPLPKCSAFEYLCHQNKNHLSETALEYYGRKFTFADLFVNVKKTAAAFRALGVKKGDIITVVSVMTPEVIYAFYAVDMIGATLNLVDPRYSVEGIHEYIEEVDLSLIHIFWSAQLIRTFTTALSASTRWWSTCLLYTSRVGRCTEGPPQDKASHHRWRCVWSGLYPYSRPACHGELPAAVDPGSPEPGRRPHQR